MEDINSSTLSIYIDESGSMKKNSKKYKSFIICLIIPTDKKKLKRVFKRYISKNINKLKNIDKQNKMFNSNGKFIEIKGSSLDKDIKLDFMDYFTKNKLFEIYYIHLDNHLIDENMYKSTARAFNYTLRLLLEHYVTNHYKNSSYVLNIDERNQKTKTKYFLEEYLNTEIGIEKKILFKVNYFDSKNSNLIQIADVFSNIYYSNDINNLYTEQFQKLKKMGILKTIFHFPKK